MKITQTFDYTMGLRTRKGVESLSGRADEREERLTFARRPEDPLTTLYHSRGVRREQSGTIYRRRATMFRRRGWRCRAAHLAAACGQQSPEDAHEDRPIQEKTIGAGLGGSHRQPDVAPRRCGNRAGICDGEPCIKVCIVKKTPELLRQIPAEIEGYTVAVKETGEIKALGP